MNFGEQTNYFGTNVSRKGARRKVKEWIYFTTKVFSLNSLFQFSMWHQQVFYMKQNEHATKGWPGWNIAPFILIEWISMQTMVRHKEQQVHLYVYLVCELLYTTSSRWDRFFVFFCCCCCSFCCLWLCI